ncbi:hypothetical protein VTJ49DRAFT_5399 [Mycothermus thermophilus]|uniref:lytic cellulose monooxygenase (C4-dehydrogenating) n=1 Tax=Humicola insolens TaxID=85995 RepID=A0ABR3V3R8_HUMIN
MSLIAIATAALAFAGTASAHTRVFGLRINGNHQGDGQFKYIRSPEDNFPVTWPQVNNPELICNKIHGVATPPAPEFLRAAAGDRVAFQWYHANPDPAQDMHTGVDVSHLGVLVTWIAPYTDGPGTGPIWTKIHEDGWANGEWATRRTLIANGGFVEFTLPKSLKPGRYLVRQEVIALHMADKREPGRGPEFYPSCAQLEVTGSGTAVPPQKFDINQGYSKNETGLWWNAYIGKNDEYRMPGPAVWTGDGAGAGAGSNQESNDQPGSTTKPGGNQPTPTPTPSQSGVGNNDSYGY